MAERARIANGRAPSIFPHFARMIYCNFIKPWLLEPHIGVAHFMFQSLSKGGAIDRLAIGLTGLCLVHCVASAVLVMVLSAAGGALLDPRIHEIGLVLAILLGVIGL